MATNAEEMAALVALKAGLNAQLETARAAIGTTYVVYLLEELTQQVQWRINEVQVYIDLSDVTGGKYGNEY